MEILWKISIVTFAFLDELDLVWIKVAPNHGQWSFNSKVAATLNANKASKTFLLDIFSFSTVLTVTIVTVNDGTISNVKFY